MIPFGHQTTFLLVALALVYGSVSPAQGQIASPQNAGQNSGNNSAISSTTTIGTPNFSQPAIISLVRGIKVKQDGSLEADPELERRLREVYQTEFSRNNLQSSTPLDSDSFLFASLDFPQSALPPASSTSTSATGNSFRIAADSQLISLPATTQYREAIRLFLKQANNSTLSASSVRLGLRLVELGSTVEPTLQLLTSVESLNTSPSVNAFSRAIIAFNTIVSNASPDVRLKLNNDSSFVGLSNALRATRNSLSAQR